MSYIVKVTRIDKGYGCRVFFNEKLIVEARCPSQEMIGPTCRDLMRTLDKLGGDGYTKSCRIRKFKEGNLCAQVKHIWGRKG